MTRMPARAWSGQATQVKGYGTGDRATGTAQNPVTVTAGSQGAVPNGSSVTVTESGAWTPDEAGTATFTLGDFSFNTVVFGLTIPVSCTFDTTPTGTLAEIGIDGKRAAEHAVLAGSPVTALCANAAGDLVVAAGTGELMLMSVQADSAEHRPGQTRAPHELIAAFLDSASEVPGGSDLEEQLVVTNGTRTWELGDLDAVDSAAGTDPTWLQIVAAVKRVSAAGITTAYDRLTACPRPRRPPSQGGTRMAARRG